MFIWVDRSFRDKILIFEHQSRCYKILILVANSTISPDNKLIRRLPRAGIKQMTNRQEKHWQKLFGHLAPEGNSWYGIWTVYSPTREVIKSSKGIRILQANSDKTIITHTNQFPLPDGTTQEKQWQIDKETCNLPDGLSHPADTSKRGIALQGEGSSAWVPKTLETGRNFSVELFLKYEDFNTSIGSIYNEQGSLEKILYLREHFGSFPDSQSEAETIDLSGKWKGTTESITPDLEVSPIVEIQELVLDPTGGKNETFLLPQVVINIPKTLPLGEEFEIIAGKLVTANQYQRLTAKYDKSGHFALLTSEIFCRE